MTETALLFREDPYLSTAEAKVVGVNERGGIILDRTIFYATGGGQPGDAGALERADGTMISIATTVYGDTKTEIVHVPAEGSPLPEIGETLVAHLDWATRHRHMRIHTGLHLLTVAVPFPVSGGRIGTEEGHLDFDIDGTVPQKEEIDARLAELIAADHAVSTEWITDDELLANPGLIKTMSVKPPMGSGRVRLVRIGDIDLQPCGGTHVQSTAEIGGLAVSKIENKGKQNRRIRVRFV
ncbi:alanyl-tRNA editing protein [Kaistia dalseonensis]|uniref:Alanine--tRNA ligase n=1 Tax=Kaistia dalseonensis TaxID=410840 RepID=A0ABU0H1R2_9HYPH|nr:alanyl-tRNA editing protein [Kaistia dalseonensis]MCX5493670.1 alanyl-tRNA editing protein [Kaistia dalseonensis]MDQ0436232.1 misacylated tRNA(Ala) deacylase [Kaistia dalseonensis]